MGAAKESPATQVLEWAVGKFDEASKIDWLEKLSSITASKPAYLRNAVLTAPAPSLPAPAPAGGDASQADLDRAEARASRAEARADSLARRVAELERQLSAQNGQAEVRLPSDEQSAEDEHKSHWWSRHH